MEGDEALADALRRGVSESSPIGPGEQPCRSLARQPGFLIAPWHDAPPTSCTTHQVRLVLHQCLLVERLGRQVQPPCLHNSP